MTSQASTSILDALRALRLFNEKADKLDASSFTKKILTERSGVEISARQGTGMVTMTATRFGPDQESIDAFVLTFRFFVQDNETRRRFNEARAAINADLDARLHLHGVG